jgi:AcrR family transcriptional regulator
MSFVSKILTDGRVRGESERHARIVEAAQRAFVRLGFHAATMQNVADEAGMSAGNLYRYFASKEALVEGLCLYDYDRRAAEFMALVSRTDVVEALVLTIKENVFASPREKAQLIVEIWAEAGRNPRVAEITRQYDAATFEGLCKLLNEAKAEQMLSIHLDVEFVASTMFSLVAGMFKRIAVEPDFDRDLESRRAVGLLRALLSGAVAPAAANHAERESC